MFFTLKNRPLIVLLASILIFGSCSQEKPNSISGRVVRIADGDTLTILDANNVQHKIRLQGIDAPERAQGFSRVSRENLSGLVFGQEVRVEYNKTDQYGRLVGKVFANGQDECLEQVKAGLAWHYKRYEKEQSPSDRQLYTKAEQDARAEKRGLWQDANPVPPWDFRHHTKGTDEESDSPDDLQPSNTNFNPTLKLNSTSKLRNENLVQGDQPNGYKSNANIGIILGNKRSMIYHSPGCPYYDAIAPHNRVHFQTRGEAERAGYRPARNCS
jgi:endonuclease YncB( thermonuclease family)